MPELRKPGGVRKQIIGGNAPALTNASREYFPFGINALEPANTMAVLKFPFAATMTNLRAKLSGTVAAGATIAVTLRLNAVDTALSVSFAPADGAAPAKSDADTVAIALDDELDVSVPITGVPGVMDVAWRLEVEPT